MEIIFYLLLTFSIASSDGVKNDVTPQDQEIQMRSETDTGVDGKHPDLKGSLPD